MRKVHERPTKYVKSQIALSYTFYIQLVKKLQILNRENCFDRLQFFDCTSPVKAPELPDWIFLDKNFKIWFFYNPNGFGFFGNSFE